MALCSSTYNPLTQLIKYSDEDRGLQRNKLVSKRTLTGLEGFRSKGSNAHEETENEYSRFNKAAGLLPTQHVERIQPFERRLEHNTRSSMVTWSSEFRRGYPIASNNPLVIKQQQQRYPKPPDLSVSNSRRASERCSRINHLLASRNSLPAMAEHFELVANAHVRSEDPPCQFFPSNPAIESLDWDELFESMDTSVHEPDVEDSVAIQLQRQPDNIAGLTTALDKEAIGIPCRDLLAAESQTDYKFQFENPFIKTPDPFEEGLNIISNDGNLSLAILAFEAACQLNPSHFEAWSMLGTIQSENEREEDAILALHEALKLDAQSTDVMMKLAVSYTNEGREVLAYEYLDRWLKEMYPSMQIPEMDPDAVSSGSSIVFERMKNSFIQAAQLSLTSGRVDPDVQVGLGVLLFSEQSYQMAADCFAAAIHSSEPGDIKADSQLHLLWNRYGACLGNEGKHEDAIDAYEMALAVRPNFVRARYNLGLLYHSNNDAMMGAKNVLQALQAYKATESKAKLDVMRIVKVGTTHGRLEEIIKRSEPKNLYEALKRCCNSMGRWDLAGVVGSGMDFRWFQNELESQ